MPEFVSILIPTHNRRDLLLRALESLRHIIIPPDTTVELLIIANGCSDDTVASVSQIAPTMPFQTRCVIEPNLSLTHARNRAMAEAASDIFAFLDDDVWVEKNWLVGILDVFHSRPADIVAGPVELWWEAVERPAWLSKRSANLLSCVYHGEKIMELKKPGLALGANFAVRRTVYQSIGNFANLGRRGNEIIGGEETEFIARALAAGHRMFYAPDATIKHWVAPKRITLQYLSAAAYGNGLARSFIPFNPARRSVTFYVTENAYRVAVYTYLEFCARFWHLRGAAIDYRIRRMTSYGVIVGAFRRYRGLPADASIPLTSLASQVAPVSRPEPSLP